MKVAVFSTHAWWSPHYETDLELIQGHLDAGDRVHHVVCNGSLPCCDFIVADNHAQGRSTEPRNFNRCVRCVARRRSGSRLLDGKVARISLASAMPRKATVLPRIPDLETLKRFRFEDFDAGQAVASSLISIFRDPFLDPAPLERTVHALLDAAIQTYLATQHLVSTLAIDRAYVFNGRFATSRAVLRAARSRGVPCFVHERGHDLQHYALYPNTTPHDLSFVKAEIERAWESSLDAPARVELGSRFFAERAQGATQSWYSFVSEQSAGRLPANWNPDRTNVAIFTSSEDEFAAVGPEWRNPIYPDQTQAVVSIIGDERLRARSDVHVYVRMHPNLKGVANTDVSRLRLVTSPAATIIPPESDVSTYALLQACSRILSFGSTVGIEAAYWGRASILAGRCMYEDLDSTYRPTNHDEVMHLLLQDTLAPKPCTGAMKYGYYMKTFGIQFRFFRPEGVVAGSFRGERLTSGGFALHSRLLVGLAAMRCAMRKVGRVAFHTSSIPATADRALQ